MALKCGHCSKYHETVAEVKNCSQFRNYKRSSPKSSTKRNKRSSSKSSTKRKKRSSSESSTKRKRHEKREPVELMPYRTLPGQSRERRFDGHYDGNRPD